MRIGLEQIAAKTGVSVSTVSRALGDKGGVSEKKKLEIVKVAEEHGYLPDSAARSLRTGQGYGLTVITPFQLPEIAAYRNTILFNKGRAEFGAIRVISFSPEDDLDALVCQAVAENCMGIVLSYIGGKLAERTRKMLSVRKIPLVTIDSKVDGFDNILIDREAGTFQAARMLLLSGCVKPVFYSVAPLDVPDDRLRGIIKAYESLGKSRDEINLLKFEGGDFNLGRELTEQFFRSNSADGIFAYSDTLATGAMRALYQMGIKVPEDVKVIGFDNIPVSEVLPVSLSTVAQPVGELADAAIKLIRRRLNNFDKPLKKEVFKTNLIVRESAPITDHSIRKEVFSHNRV
jgi:DNA-binding LacI/PurR family transcriptional regulator